MSNCSTIVRRPDWGGGWAHWDSLRLMVLPAPPGHPLHQVWNVWTKESATISAGINKTPVRSVRWHYELPNIRAETHYDLEWKIFTPLLCRCTTHAESFFRRWCLPLLAGMEYQRTFVNMPRSLCILSNDARNSYAIHTRQFTGRRCAPTAWRRLQFYQAATFVVIQLGICCVHDTGVSWQWDTILRWPQKVFAYKHQHDILTLMERSHCTVSVCVFLGRSRSQERTQNT